MRFAVDGLFLRRTFLEGLLYDFFKGLKSLRHLSYFLRGAVEIPPLFILSLVEQDLRLLRSSFQHTLHQHQEQVCQLRAGCRRNNTRKSFLFGWRCLRQSTCPKGLFHLPLEGSSNPVRRGQLTSYSSGG